MRKNASEAAQKRRFAGVRGLTSFSADWAFSVLAPSPRPIACSLSQQAAMGHGRRLGVRVEQALPRRFLRDSKVVGTATDAFARKDGVEKNPWRRAFRPLS